MGHALPRESGAWVPSPQLIALMIERPKDVARKILGSEPSAAQCRLVKAIGRALEHAPAGSSPAFNVRPAPAIYAVPPDSPFRTRRSADMPPPVVTMGRIVRYVLPEDSQSAGQERPAIIVRVWSETCVNLQVFTDCENDGPGYASGLVHKSSVQFDADDRLGSCHWPEKA